MLMKESIVWVIMIFESVLNAIALSKSVNRDIKLTEFILP